MITINKSIIFDKVLMRCIRLKDYEPIKLLIYKFIPNNVYEILNYIYS